MSYHWPGVSATYITQLLTHAAYTHVLCLSVLMKTRAARKSRQKFSKITVDC